MQDYMMLYRKIKPKPLLYILVVDDNQSFRATLINFIKRYFKATLKLDPDRIKFDQAIDGGAAMFAVQRRLEEGRPPYDIITMDLNMHKDAEKCGLATTKAIRALEAKSNLKPAYIIRHSTQKLKPDETLAEQGFDAVLNKPARPVEVADALELALKDHPAIRKPYDEPPPRPSS